jgi:hypothetical protein
MLINRRIKLGDRNFYISCECEYNKKDGYIALELKNYKDKYYDDGDLSILIEKIENNYDDSTYKKYDTEKWLVSDCLYIYDNIPFISGVGDYRVSPVDGNIVSTTYISKEELDEFIKNNNIEMNDKNKFKLVDERTWFLK